MIVAEVIFWVSLLWIVYVFIGYPLLMGLLAKLRGKPLAPRPSPLPSVTFVMSAYNEERVIARKLQNYLDIDYPRELLKFFVGSDASSDRTDEIVRSFQRSDPSIRLERFNRCGKTQIIYELASEVESDIIVFTDADVLLERGALRHAVECLSDPEVGGVICRLEYSDRRATAGSSGEIKFTELEHFLCRTESLFWTTVVPTGQCYAVRRGAYTPLKNYKLSDDLNLSITIPLNGYRVWFEPRFSVQELNKRTLSSEMNRRLRMGQQATATYFTFPETRYPWRSMVGFQIWSHKLLRNLAAVPAVLLLGSSLLLAGQSTLYLVVAAGCLAWLAALIVGMVCEWRQLNFRILLYPLYFSAMVLSLTIGSVRAAFSGGLEMWNSPRLE